MSSNQRACFRCPTPAEGAQVLLQLPRKKLMAELVDQSAGGFSVRYRGKRRVRLGQIIKLRSNAGWCEVEVVHLEKNGSETRAGLKRVRELSDPRLDAILNHNSLPPILSVGGSRAKKGPLGIALTTILGLIVAFWISVSQPIWLTRISEWWQVQTWTNGNVATDSSNSTEPASGK